MAQQGPSGGNGGTAFFANNPSSQITQVAITSGAYVNTLRIQWADGSFRQYGNVYGPTPTLL